MKPDGIYLENNKKIVYHNGIRITPEDDVSNGGKYDYYAAYDLAESPEQANFIEPLEIYMTMISLNTSIKEGKLLTTDETIKLCTIEDIPINKFKYFIENYKYAKVDKSRLKPIIKLAEKFIDSDPVFKELLSILK